MAISTKNISKQKRKFIYARDNYKCVYCNNTFDLSLDHISPFSKNGSDSNKNLVTCCNYCNNSKGNKSLDAWLKQQVKKRIFDTFDKIRIVSYIENL